MSKVIAEREDLVAIADATRNATGTTEQMSLYQIANTINELNIGANGVSSWNDLKDKPFGETTVKGDTLTWDGNTEGLTGFDLGMGMPTHYCVSDAIPTLEDLQQGGTVITPDGSVPFDITAVEPFVDNVYAIQANGFPVVVIVFEETVAPDGATMNKGTYFLYMNGMGVSSFTVNGYNGFERTEIVPIPPKYIPSGNITESNGTANLNAYQINELMCKGVICYTIYEGSVYYASLFDIQDTPEATKYIFNNLYNTDENVHVYGDGAYEFNGGK